MEKRKNLYTVFAYAFAAFMVLLAGISLFTHDNPFLELGRIQLIAATAMVGCALAGVILLWDKKGREPKREWLVLAVLFAVYFVFQMISAQLFQVYQRGDWDYTFIFREAEDRVLRGTMPTDYFGKFPNNIPYYWVLCGFFWIMHQFGVTEFMMPLLVFNSICIDIALFFMYAAARRIVGKKWALMILGLGMTAPALLLYVPIAYTDTLTLPFVCIAAYLWITARDHHKEGQRKKAVLFAAAAGAVAAIGAVMKISIAILLVAFALDVMIAWTDKKRWISCISTVLCFGLVLSGLSTAAKAAMPEYDMVGIPYTHWIMMGLHETGLYYDTDYESTLSYPTYEERVEFNKQEIVRRVKEMGPIGFLDHCRAKLAFMISDGTYYAPRKLDRAGNNPGIWHEFVLSGGKYAGFLYYFADALQVCLLLACAWGSFRAARTGKHDFTVFRIALFGIVMFLLIWENRSRYLVNFIPLFLMCAGVGLIPQIKEKKKQKDKG